MKQVAIFLLLLFPIFVSSYAHCCVNNDRVVCSFSQHNKKQAAFNSDKTLKENVTIIADNDYLTSAEDDDDNEETARKNISHNKYFVPFSRLFNPNNFYNSLASILPSCTNVIGATSYKYLEYHSLII